MRTQPTGPRAEPLEPSQAVVAIEGASDREQIFELLLRAARSVARYAALLSVHSEHLRGRRALADDGFDTSKIKSVEIPRNAVPALERAIASREPIVATLATGDEFVDGFLAALGTPASAIVLPILLGGRTVAFVLAHRGDAALADDAAIELVPIAAAGSQALSRVLAGRAATAKPVQRAATEVDDVATKRRRLGEYRRNEVWDQLADAIRDLLHEGMTTGEPDEDEQLALLVELGKLEADKLGRPDEALAAWRNALAIDASDERVLDAMEAFFVANRRWSECAELLEKRVALTEQPRARSAQLVKLASLAHEQLADDDRAIEAYERILAWEPHHEGALRALESLYASTQRWQPLVALLLERADLASLEQAANIYADELGDARAAFLVWLAVIRRAPDRPMLLEQLYRLAPLANAWDEILGECSVLAEQLEAAHPALTAGVWHLIGRWMRDRVDNQDAAVRAFEHAVRLAPDDADMLSELLEILRALERWPQLVALLAARAELEHDPARRAELHSELADIHETRLDKREEAIAYYERAAADEPDEAAALVALHRLYLESEAWEQLAALLPKLVEALSAESPQVLVDLHVELGQIRADQLGRPDLAAAAFRDALAIDPRHAAAFAGLEKALQASGDTDALIDATEDSIDAADRAAQLARYPDVAARWQAARRTDRAAATWRKVLALDGKHAAAHAGLVTALRDAEQWDALAAAMRAQLVHADPAERTTLLVELADLLETKLGDVEGALAASQDVFAQAPQHRVALDNIARLADRSGRRQVALDALERLLALTQEPSVRAELFARVGHIHVATHDTIKAQGAFGQSLALEPQNPRAHEGMARVHLLEGKLVIAAEELVRAAQLAGDQADTLRCLGDAAWLYRHRIADVERAREALLCILELQPDHADAKQALAELLHDSQQWETLWPVLEQQLARAEDLPPAERHALTMRAARCAVELGRFPAALELYDRAVAIEATPAALLDRADALYRSMALDAAEAAYQTIVARHASALDRHSASPSGEAARLGKAEAFDRTQLAGVYRRLARIATELGHASQAVQYHHKVLDIEPAHHETLEDLVELHLARGHVDEAIASLRQLAAHADAQRRIGYLERIGDLYRDQLANAPRAMSTYLEALDLDDANRRILQRLLDLQSGSGQWKAAVDTIDKFLAHERDPARRASYQLASAEIRRTHLVDRSGATERYDAALDELLTAGARDRAFEVFGTLTELATAEGNWKYVEQLYRRLIKRLPVDDPALLSLWDALGDVYRVHLKHPQTAIEVYEVAHALDPDKSPQRARLLAELYVHTGTAQPERGFRDAGPRAAKLVEVDPTNPDAYRALGKTAFDAGRIDEAWCAARALVFLKQANAEETALYRRYEQHAARKANGILDEDAWDLVRHPDENRAISGIFALTWEAAVALKAAPAKSFELKAKERMPVEHDTRVVAKIFRHAARVLNISLPEVYIQPRRAGRLLLANCIDKGRLAPAVIVGRDLMTGYRDTEIAAAVGATLALLRPTYYLKLAAADELDAALAAALLLVGHPAPRADEALVAAITAELKPRFTRATAQALLAFANGLGEPDLVRWRAAVDTASYRAGFLISGDLAATARMVSSDAVGASRPRQRVQELIAYSVSPAYFQVRQHLGLAVG